MIYENELLRLTPSEAATLEMYELRDMRAQMTVARVIVPATPCAGPEDSLAEAGALLLRAPHGVITVVDRDRPVGLLTWADVLRAAVARGAPAAGDPEPFVPEKVITSTRKGAGMNRNHFSEAVKHARCAVVRNEHSQYAEDVYSVLGELAKAITDLAEGLAEQDRFFRGYAEDHTN